MPGMPSNSSRSELGLTRLPKQYYKQDRESIDGSDGSDSETIDVVRERFPGPQARHTYKNDMAGLSEMLQNTQLESRGRYQDISEAEMGYQKNMERLKWREKNLEKLRKTLGDWDESLKSRDRALCREENDLKNLDRELWYEEEDLKSHRKKCESWGKDLKHWEADLEDREGRSTRQGIRGSNDCREITKFSRHESHYPKYRS
jgi:chromosome segregation ATPase